MGHRNLMRVTVTSVTEASADVHWRRSQGCRPAKFDAHALKGNNRSGHAA